jgi:hypothetical protein
LKRGSRKVHVDMTKPDVFLEVSEAYKWYIQRRDFFWISTIKFTFSASWWNDYWRIWTWRIWSSAII